MSNFRPRQCGLFIVILSSTLSLKTVVFFYPLLFLRLLSPRLKYSRLALCMNALPYAPYFRQRFAPFFRHRRRSQGYPYRIAQTKKLSTRIGYGGSPCDTSPTKLKINIILSHSDDRVTVGIHCVLTDAYNFNKRGVQK